MRLTHGAMADLGWFTKLRGNAEVGQALWQPTVGLLTTDASPYGWGGHLDNLVPAAGFFTLADQDHHINIKEVAAVRLCLSSFSGLLDGRSGVLKVKADNSVAMHVLNGFSSRSAALMEELRKLRLQLRTMRVTLEASWLPSIANGWADLLSRRRDRNDWRLAPEWFARLDRRWGRHTVDQFATCVNAHVARFNSELCNPGSEGVNALQQQWEGENNWANPPFSLASEVVNHVLKTKATATLVLPVWQAQPWWAVAVAHAQEAYLLPRVDGLFLDGKTQTPAPHPTWRVAVFRFVDGGRATPLPPPSSVPPSGDGIIWPTPLAGNVGASSNWRWRVPPPDEALTPLPSASCAPAASATPPRGPTAPHGGPSLDTVRSTDDGRCPPLPLPSASTLGTSGSRGRSPRSPSSRCLRPSASGTLPPGSLTRATTTASARPSKASA